MGVLGFVIIKYFFQMWEQRSRFKKKMVYRRLALKKNPHLICDKKLKQHTLTIIHFIEYFFLCFSTCCKLVF